MDFLNYGNPGTSTLGTALIEDEEGTESSESKILWIYKGLPSFAVEPSFSE